jgi:hypothetical protein
VELAMTVLALPDGRPALSAAGIIPWRIAVDLLLTYPSVNSGVSHCSFGFISI